MDKKIIIFGCGKLGHEAIGVLGSENIECFCDNNSELTGKEKYGKSVISFDELKRKYSNAVVMICANVRWGNAYAMAEQCEENGISDYFLYQSIREKEFFLQQEKLLAFIGNVLNRKTLKNDMYIQKGEELQKQVNYLKRHIDIRHIRPAGGKLRERQLELVHAAAKLLENLSELEISPFLYGGNLLGYVRHNGFVPWDDDIDFALMREEYEKLKEYCMRNMYTDKEFWGQEKSNKHVTEKLKGYYWRNGGGDEFNIYQPFPDGSKVVIDFFVLDYYVDGYSLNELLNLAKEVRGQLSDAIFDNEKKIKLFQKVLKENHKNIAKESNYIYFGIDNMEIMHKFHKGSWIPKEVIFPLKKVPYEGEYFFVPNDAEEFLRYEYENIWELPDDLGIPQHIKNAVSILDDKEEW